MQTGEAEHVPHGLRSALSGRDGLTTSELIRCRIIIEGERKGMGLKVGELCDAAEIARPLFYRMRKDEPTTGSTVTKLANALGCLAKIHGVLCPTKVKGGKIELTDMHGQRWIIVPKEGNRTELI